MAKKTIEEKLDKIVKSIPPVVGAGWHRKDDEGNFKIYEIRVPKIAKDINDLMVCGGRSGCRNQATEEPHTYPYKEDVNNDSSYKCLCCSECQQECCDDI